MANERGTALIPLRVTNLYDRRTVLEKQVREGENPVIEIVKTRDMSTARHVESCRNFEDHLIRLNTL